MSVLTDLGERLRSLVFRRRDEREMADELRFHVEMEAEQHRRRGLSEDEARRRSFISLGGMERTKEEVRDARGTRLLDDTRADLAFTFRTLAHSPGFAIVAILTLAIGIGGTTAVYSAVDAVLLQPLPYQQPGQLVRLYESYGKTSGITGFVTPVYFLEYRNRLSSLQGMAALLTYNETGADIGSGDAVRRIRLMPVSADYFDVLRTRPELGRPFDRDQENGAPAVILSHSLWQQEFHSSAAAIGQDLVMSGRRYTVTGVMPAGFADPVAGAVDAWVPLDLTEGRDASNASNHYLTVIGRLGSGVDAEHANAELGVVDAALAGQYPNAKDKRSRVYPLKHDLVQASTRSLEIMLGAVGLVLVLVCVNIANLLLVRGSERAREFAVRAAIGAHRARLVRQMLLESLTLAVLGAAAGLVVARIAMTAIVRLGAGSIPRLTTLTLEPRLLAFSIGIATLCAVGFGLAPALRAARTDPGDVLREQGRSGTGSGGSMRLREWLVVSQVALAFVLLVGAGLLVASVQQIRSVNLGIKPAGALVFELHLPDARYDSTARAAFFERTADELARIPGVTAAGGVSRLPATGPYHQWGVTALSGPLANDPVRGGLEAEVRIVSGHYFEAAGIPLLDGRRFDATDDASAPGHSLVSRSLAQSLFPGVRAVGQRIQNGGRETEIIGVVGDVAVDAEGTPDRYVYQPHRQWAGDRNWPLTQVVRTAGPIAQIEPAARRALASLDPALVMFRPMPLADAVGQGEAQRTFTLRILAAFALVALALAALGLFGVLSYGVRLRSREFGIRMALGADRRAIRRMVVAQGLVMIGAGIAAGLLGAVALARVMTAVVFHVRPLEPGVLAAAALFLAVIGIGAAYLPARRATAVEPRTALQ